VLYLSQVPFRSTLFPSSPLTIADMEEIMPQTMTARESPTKNRPGWRHANAARRKYGRRSALKMWTLKLNGFRGNAIARLANTTPAAVYQRLYRLRRGRYARTSSQRTLEGVER
jgi:hypothetical protein